MQIGNNVVDLFDRIVQAWSGKRSDRGPRRGLRPFWNLAPTGKPESRRLAYYGRPIGDRAIIAAIHM